MTIIKTRTDTAANFTSANTTLAAGERAIESDTGKEKVGPGSWNSLPYLSTGVDLQSGSLSAATDVAATPTAVINHVTAQINALISAAPGALNTLDELAAALGDDANFATTVTNSLAAKQASLVSGTNIKTVNGASVLGSGDLTVSAGGMASISYATAIPLDAVDGKDMGLHVLTGNDNFTAATSPAAVNNGACLLSLQLAGSFVPTFAAEFSVQGDTITAEDGRVYEIAFVKRPGGALAVVTKTAFVIDTTAPVLGTPHAEDAATNKILVPVTELHTASLNGSTAGITLGGAGLGGRTCTAVAVTGGNLEITLSSALTSVSVVTVAIASGMVKDGSGNLSAAKTTTSVVNNISPTGIKVRIDNPKGSIMTESGDGTAGWNYISSTASCYAGAGESGISTATLGSGVDGYLQATQGGPFVHDNGLRLCLVPTGSDHDFPSTQYGLLANFSLYNIPGQFGGGTKNGADVVPAVGDMLQVIRSGSTILAQVSKDSGSTWTTVHTYSGASTGALAAFISVTSSCALNNLNSDAMA